MERHLRLVELYYSIDQGRVWRPGGSVTPERRGFEFRAERDGLYERLVAKQYENGQAMNMAATLEIDAVIDPAQTRSWLVRGLASATRKESPGAMYVDTW